MPKAKAKLKAEKKPAEPPKRTPDEQALVDTFADKSRLQAAPKLKLQAIDNDTEKLAFEGDTILEIAKLARAFGADDWEAAQHLANQLATTVPALSLNKSMEIATNTAISLMAGIAPRDTVEGLLAMQMVATHTAAMEHMRKLALQQPNIDIYDSINNRATKLMRTFAAQVEALNRYRNAGKQTITVNHIGQQVNANEAIAVGCLPGEAGGIIKNGALPHVSQGNQRLNYRPEDDMRSEGETQRETLPASADDQRPMLSPRRSQPRRATRTSELELQARPIHEGSKG